MSSAELRPESPLPDGLFSVRVVLRFGKMGLTERSTVADLAKIDARAEAALGTACQPASSAWPGRFSTGDQNR